MKLDGHPTVQAVRKRGLLRLDQRVAGVLDAEWLRAAAIESGADDVAMVSIDDPGLDDEREHILNALPGARSVVAFCCRMVRDNVRSPARSVANKEFHVAAEDVDHVGRKLSLALEERGMRAIYPAGTFPQEMDRFPGRIWVVAHKTIAVAAGLGQMGIHRNVIHPKFGNFIILGSILTDAEIDTYNEPLDYNPCFECKLCVAACPVGAISNTGEFDFSACYTHNYREFMSGFTDWAQTVADSDSAEDYRARVTDSESASMWQSLSYGANYKAAYCMAVCPAGEDVISPYLANRKEFTEQVVRPLQRKEEVVYVAPGSAAGAYVAKRFPHKTVREVDNGLGPPQPRGRGRGKGPPQD